MIKLDRTEMPQKGVAFVVMPFGTEPIDGGTMIDFDELYQEIYSPAISRCGMTVVRADGIWGSTKAILEVVWRGIQSAEVVIVDCSARSVDVGLELGLAMALGKRLVVAAQRLEDIPTDLRGHLRPVLYTPEGIGLAGLMSKLEKEIETVRGETVTENSFFPLRDGQTEHKPGRIISVEKDFAVVETEGDHELLHLYRDNVTYATRIADMTRRFKYGDRVSGAITTDVKGHRYYTCLVDQPNPWPTIETDYPAGRVFTSRVQNVVDGKGAWVVIAHGVNGYLPMSAVKQAGLRRDDGVEVEILTVDPEARRVSLRLRGPVRLPGDLRTAGRPARPGPARPEPVSPLPGSGLPPAGARMRAWVVSSVPGKGFALLELEGYENGQPGILHISKMTPALQQDLRDGKLEEDEEIAVEVTSVQPGAAGRWRIELREVPEQAPQLAA